MTHNPSAEDKTQSLPGKSITSPVFPATTAKKRKKKKETNAPSNNPTKQAMRIAFHRSLLLSRMMIANRSHVVSLEKWCPLSETCDDPTGLLQLSIVGSTVVIVAK